MSAKVTPLPLLLPPHSVECEQSVIGSLLMDSAVFDKVADILGEDDFFRDDHRRIFRHIAKLIEAREVVDVVTVADSLAASKEDEQAGGLAYLGEIANNTPSSANVVGYANVVREKALLRRMIAASHETAAEAHASRAEQVDDLIERANARLLEIAESRARKQTGFVRIGQTMQEVVTRLDELSSSDVGNGVTGLSTGFADLDVKTSGFHDGDLVVVAGRPSMGKAQPLSAKVLLDDGRWKTLGEVRFGDRLASVDGGRSVVTGVFPQGEREMFRIRFSDGRETRCCAEHLWSVNSSRWVGGARVKTTAELIDLLSTPRYCRRLSIPLAEGRFGNDDGVTVDPWLLGVLLGNGACGDARLMLSTPDAQTLFRVQEIVGHGCVRYAGGYDYRINRGGSGDLHAKIDALGLAGKNSYDKFIPDAYLRASRSVRLALLQGLLDTDGWVESFGSVRVALSNETLARQVQYLVRSLGGLCTIGSKQPSFVYDGEKKKGVTSYVCNISHPQRRSLFTLARKQRRCRDDARFRAPSIVSIEEDGREQAVCIKVSHPSSLYVTDDFIVTHNTAFALNIAEHVAEKEGGTVAVFSMEMPTTQLAMRLLASVGRINQQGLRTGRLHDDEWARVTEALGRLDGLPIFIDETPALSSTELRARVKRLERAEGRLSLVVVDYLQLMRASREGIDNRATEVGEISRSLKALAKELRCPVIALSQLNRALEQRPNKRPVMSDLRESGAIEQDADTILFIYRDEVYHPDSPDLGTAEIILGKQRNGPIGMERLAFVNALTRFENLAPDWKQPVAAAGVPQERGWRA